MEGKEMVLGVEGRELALGGKSAPATVTTTRISATVTRDNDKDIGPSIAQVRKQQTIPVKPTSDKDGNCFCASHCFCGNCSQDKKDVARHGCDAAMTEKIRSFIYYRY